MSIARGSVRACCTARCVISLKVRRCSGRRLPLSASARCQAIASPSRSGSGARNTLDAVFAASLIFASAWFLVRIGTYSGSKSFSRSTPSLLLGRSMMWPFEATTVKPRPRNLVSVRDLVGDSTITSDLEPSLAGASAARFGPGALRPAPRRRVAAFPAPAAGADSREVRREARFAGVARASGSAFLPAAGARDLVAAAALLVREVEFAMTRLQPLAGIVDLERHPGGHVAGQIHAHRTDAATA